MSKHGPTAQDRIIGNNLRKYRLLRELTQTELADHLHLTFQQVQKYEKGTNRVSGGRIVQICRFLGITNAQLLNPEGYVEANAAIDEINILGANPHGMALAKAFNRIDDSRTRSLVVEMVQRLSGSYRDVAKPATPIRAVHREQSAANGT